MTAPRAPVDVATIGPVPDPPSLAPEVTLAGRLDGGGYAEPQYLVERAGRYLQLPELLYRIAEGIDGRRSVTEVAAEVTARTHWDVPAEVAAEAIRTKLVPAGIVTPPEGTQVLRRHTRSPLQVALRVRLLGPAGIERLARPLARLFAPAVLLPMLAGIVAAHVWLYLVHGVEGSVYRVLEAPGLIPIVLAISLASALWHELGHAAALRYGGGRARRIGLGVYLIWPVFFTDVTESYRLGRSDRVRTDLGGFYFHLIFAVAVILAAAATGQDFLLLIAVLVNIDIARQFLPFVRLDGYWALADLTGVTDFFTQMRVYFAGLLRRRGSGRAPALRPMVRRVFLAYCAVTIPALVLGIVLLASWMPGFVAAAWTSASRLAATARGAAGEGDMLAFLESASQLLILAAPLVGSTAIVYLMARMVVEAIRRRAETRSPAARRPVARGAARAPRRRPVLALDPPPTGPVPEDVIRRFEESLEREAERSRRRSRATAGPSTAPGPG